MNSFHLTSKHYLVGGHLFSISLPQGVISWEQLGQYAPFETNLTENELFNFELAEELPHGEVNLILDVKAEEGFTSVTVYKTGPDWFFEIRSTSGIFAEMMVSKDFSRARFCPHSSRKTEIMYLFNTAMMLQYAFATCPYKTLEMHASVVRNAGKAYLFLGKSGTGKSTHSSLWLENIPGSDLMNDDNPVVRVLEDGTVMAYGSPWSGKTPCYRNVEAPVGAFVQIRRSKENIASQMNVIEAYATLYSSCSGLKMESEFADVIHPTLEAVATSTRFFYMDCRPDKEAAEVCHGAVCR